MSVRSPIAEPPLRATRLRHLQLQTPRLPALRKSAIRSTVLIAVLSLAFGCSEEAVLLVDDVGFERSRLLGLSDDSVERLIAISTVGIAMAREDEETVARPFVAEELDALRVARLREWTILEDEGVDEAQLERWYVADPEPELVVRHLVILAERWRAPGKRAEARARAAEALLEIQRGRPFAEVAGEFSEEPGAAERGGLLAPGREGTWVRDFWSAANLLQPGETSGVVESEYGFHILRLDERRAVPFDEARDRFAARVAAGFADEEVWDARVEAWMAAAASPPGAELRLDVLLAESERRAITLATADSLRVVDAWTRRIRGWAGTLGFEEGMNATDIAETALRALGRTDQEARIARDELSASAGALSAMYPVRRSEL